MWFVIPAGSARRWVALAGAILVLGWLSGIGQHSPVGGRSSEAATVRTPGHAGDRSTSSRYTRPSRPTTDCTPDTGRATPTQPANGRRLPGDSAQPLNGQGVAGAAQPLNGQGVAGAAQPLNGQGVAGPAQPLNGQGSDGLAKPLNGQGAASGSVRPFGGCGNVKGGPGVVGWPIAGCSASRCVALHFGPRPAPPPAPPAVDCRRVKCVALTFDDGPGPYTVTLLRMLAARHARASFFLIGGNIKGREAVVRQELAAGHAIGDHTWTHPDLTKLSSAAVRSQLVRTLNEIRAATGRPVTMMRPPYGATDKHVAKTARGLGFAEILWSVDTDDWLDRNSRIVAFRAVHWAHRGDIILMHDIHPTTIAAVPAILRGLAKRGFTFVTVPELLAAHPMKPGTVYFDQG
jgi:peptidoglycan/xylan/chitin deacetylase (PgdA/CDA1 family)